MFAIKIINLNTKIKVFTIKTFRILILKVIKIDENNIYINIALIEEDIMIL